MGKRGERFDIYLKTKKITRHFAERACRLSNGLLSKSARTNADLGLESIEKILRTYPDLNRDWLISGDGTMLRTATATAAPLASNTNNAPISGSLTQTATATVAEPSSSSSPDELATLRIENRLLREQNERLIAALAGRSS
ncbi:MAG: hypothetical protein LUD72_11640 [Bacteroidales bacterium]|nr:hypothetical protein [Bacteroidales bacterium]